MKKPFNKIKIILLFVSTALVCSNDLLAQQQESPKSKVAQISFAYPISSNGVKSPNYANKFSFNILYGVNGGVNGFELGAIANINKGNVNGLQIAGLTNINHSTFGIQIAGLVNYNKGKRKGFQLAAIANVNADSSKGANLGIINFNNSAHRGIQIGVINYSKSLKGFQLGLVNIVKDTGRFVPIGLFNIVKNGYYDLEITGGEAIYFNINYKMGVEKFYTIYKLGTAFSYKDKSVYTFGLGFGTLVNLNEKSKLSIDASANQILYDNQITDNVNLLTKLDLNYRYSFTSKFSIIIGPSLNVYYTEQIIDGKYGIIDVPYEISSETNSNSRNMIWIGGNLGLSYKL